MHCKRRKLSFPSGAILETPLLLPSFSSKTFHDKKVVDTLRFARELITDEMLVSLYDVHYEGIRTSLLRGATAIFLDSGGYEASDDFGLSDIRKKGYHPKDWSKRRFSETLDKHWDFNIPTVLVSFDSPSARTTIEKQISRARKDFGKYASALHCILFKAERAKQRYLDIDEIIAHKHKLADFHAIGMTEKELGDSTLQRMVNISRIRKALSDADLDLPIHIFGSLDSISCPLYFFAGADVFDGLTWLRYAFKDGQTIYKHNYGVMAMGIGFEDYKINAKVWNDNYFYLTNLKASMRRFLQTKSYAEFGPNANVFEQAVTQFEEKVK